MNNPFPIYIPDNAHGIPEGSYTRNAFVAFLRVFASNPAVIRYLADMLEE